MLATFIKKKLTDNQVANIFINTLFETIDSGFPAVAQFINDDIAFVESPCIDPHNSDEFSLIVLIGNLSVIEKLFGNLHQQSELEQLLYEKLATIYQMSSPSFKDFVCSYKDFIMRTNFPSKNIIYGMSKAVFHKYNLNTFQDDFFKPRNTPNPLFLKRLNSVMESFIWDWDAFQKKYRIN